MSDVINTNYKFIEPEVGASEDTWGDKLNDNWGKLDALLNGDSYTDINSNVVQEIQPDLAALKIGGSTVTSSVAELNKLDGVTATTAELNYVDGVTSSIQTQLNDKVSAVTAGSGLSGGGSSGTVTVSHANTSSQSSVNNSGNTYIQDITLDTYGHITDINSATVTVPTLNYFSSSTSFGNNTVYNLPTDTFMLQGTSYHYMGSNQGSRLDIYVYSSTGGGGTRIQTYIVSGGNELDGNDGGSGMSTRCGWAIVLPSNARSIKFVKGDGARAITGKIEAGMKFTNYFS